MIIPWLTSENNERNINVYLTVKPSVPEQAGMRYKINNIFIHSNYSLENSGEINDTIKTGGAYYIYKKQNIKPLLVTRSIIFSKGGYYSYKQYESSLNKLSGLGIFKFTNIDFKPALSDSNLLDADVYLTQFVPKSLRVEIEAVTKSNDYAGPDITFSYNDRNFLRSAEQFTINLKASFETQLSAAKGGGNSFETGINGKLSVPRFLFPFIDLNRLLSKQYTPKTNISAGYDFYYRTQYFRMNTFNLQFGYTWRETSTKSHDFRVIDLRYSHLTHKTEAFQSILDSNILVKQSFNEELILGLNYTYTEFHQFSEQWFISFSR